MAWEMEVRAPAPAGGAGSGPVRQLGLLTVLCIGVNNIVGSGIYKTPSDLARELGPASWLAFASDGLLLVCVALCYAAMAARHDEAGGPYVYARRAFGKHVAFAVAWTGWISMWAAMAAVATAIPDYLPVFMPGLETQGVDGAITAGSRALRAAIGIGIVLALGAINCVGVKPAAGTSTFLTIAKLVPLLVFVGAGVFFVDWSRVDAVPESFGDAGRAAFGRALFAAFYPLQGFEVVPVPAGELRNPRRDVPLSVTISLLLSAGLYCLVQVVAFAACPGIAGMAGIEAGNAVEAARPLSEAAGAFLGGFGRKLMAVGACISMLGFAAVTILCAPRFLVALGNDGLLPAAFARHHPRWGTPVLAVVVTTLAALFGTLFPMIDALGGGAAFARLTGLSNVAVLVQYVATCLAVIALRAHAPGPEGGFRLPGGRFPIPLLGLLTCAVFAVIAFQESALEQIAVFAAWVALGFALSGLARRAGRRSRT